ncbi:MAG: peptidase M50 [Desulfosarcinaceae bacterium]|nr:peptidase M50 [Desulfosarcinaceae bacterium]
MQDSIFSPYWYRVANLKPALRESVEIARHEYRGQIWYVLRNRLTGRSHRFNAAAYRLVGLMDGRRSVQAIWEAAEAADMAQAPTQDGVIRLLGQLHDSGLIQSDILPSIAAIFHKAQKQHLRQWRQTLSNPLSVRLPLANPDRFLDRWCRWTGPLLNLGTFLLWLLIVLSAVVVALQHWPDLTHRLNDRLLQPGNLLMIWLIFPLMKILHELGHAVAVKKWGGEVNEMGILLLALTPIPYVDASASTLFAAKHRRITVAAMGMMVETLLAALAVFVWVNVAPGLISALAFNVMLIGGASTLLFNGNPLLRYDGYYILADLIEIPNLAQRANHYLNYLVHRYLLAAENAESPVIAPGEKAWFIAYGPIAFCYRILVLIGLVWMISGRFFVVGILIAVWGAVSLCILPAVRWVIRTMDLAGPRRGRMVTTTAGLLLGAGLLIFYLPLPFWTTSQGVIWLPENAIVRAGTDCEVMELLATDRTMVEKDAPLLRGSDALLETQRALHRAELTELLVRYHALSLKERVKRRLLLEEIERAKGDLRQIEEKIDQLMVRSPARGQLVLVDAGELAGSFIKEGQLLGYIIAHHRPTVRTVVNQDDIGLVRGQLRGVQIRLFERVATPLDAEIDRLVPAADLKLPSAALGTAGGGPIPIDPSDPEGLRALESHFQVDLRLPEEIPLPHIGGRAHVRFDHGRLPLGLQWYRSLRQLVLRRFYV